MGYLRIRIQHPPKSRFVCGNVFRLLAAVALSQTTNLTAYQYQVPGTVYDSQGVYVAHPILYTHRTAPPQRYTTPVVIILPLYVESCATTRVITRGIYEHGVPVTSIPHPVRHWPIISRWVGSCVAAVVVCCCGNNHNSMWWKTSLKLW